MNTSRSVTQNVSDKKKQIVLGRIILAGIAVLIVGIGYSAMTRSHPKAVGAVTAAPDLAPEISMSTKPSFDCASAENAAEQMVCSNGNLAALDVQLASLYKAAREAAEDPRVIVTEQRQWVDERNACTTVECLTNVYDKRVTKLAAWVGPTQ